MPFHNTPTTQDADTGLLAVLADANARKVVGAKFSIPTGSIPVLIALYLAKGCHPRRLSSAKIATPTLTRTYVKQLVEAKLVERSTNGRARWLRLSLNGLGVISTYERELRTGSRHFTCD